MRGKRGRASNPHPFAKGAKGWATRPQCAFDSGGQSYMSLNGGKFVWRAVEKRHVGRSGGPILTPQTTREGWRNRQNYPTQANTGLEWAIQQVAACM